VTGSPAFRLERCGSSQGRGAVFVGEDALPAETEYEKLRAKYREEDARGIPMSVPERYEKALADLRRELRQRTRRQRLGQILLAMNTIDQDTLARALAEQEAEGRGPFWERFS